MASAALGIVAYVMIHWPGLYSGGEPEIAALAMTIGAGTGTYFAAATLLRAREVTELRLVGRAKSTEMNAG